MVNDRRTRRSKRALRDAYISLITDRDQKKITVAEVARRADVDRKTFYAHYQSTDEISTDFINDGINRIMALLDECGYWDSPFDSQMLFDSFFTVMSKDAETYKRIANAPDNGDFWDKLSTVLGSAMCDKLCAALTDAPRDEVAIFARYFASGAVYVYLTWLRGEIPLSLAHTARILGELAISGISAAHGALSWAHRPSQRAIS